MPAASTLRTDENFVLLRLLKDAPACSRQTKFFVGAIHELPLQAYDATSREHIYAFPTDVPALKIPFTDV
jgi:hypothetical protein